MNRKLRHLLERIRNLGFFAEYLIALALCPLLKRMPAYQDLWIIAERGTEAKDNASHLFRYIREQHPEINICYIISKDSADREKMEKLGRVIDYRSFCHFLVFAASQVKISTHIMGFSPDMLLFKDLDHLMPSRGVKVFLQHGITKDNLPYLYGNNVKLSLFVCGAKKEWEYIRSTFGHPDGVVQYLGFCRYDSLPQAHQESRTVLLMPTWRIYINDAISSDAQFKACPYYHAYQSLLTNPRLERILEKYDYTLKFYPHYGVQPYLHCFTPAGERIQLVSARDMDVQPALIEADALLTDFSSVFFDFGYMGKPVLHYQFDLEDYRKNQYQEGYFDYQRDGFGEVLLEEEAFLDALDAMLAGGCRLEEPYRSRIDVFFPMRDSDNCRRNFEAINRLWKKEL